MRWHGNRTAERWAFRAVSWPEMEEGEELWQVTGGSASLSLFADLSESGSIDFSGPSLPDGNGLVRVYYSFLDEAGERYEEPVLTGFADVGDVELGEGLASGSADIRGMLCVAADTGPGYPLTVPSGTLAVDAAAGYARALGLRVSATPSSYRLGSPRTFEQGDSWLAIINWLLGAAGYSSAGADAWGTVLLRPYVEPMEREAAWTLRDDETSFFRPKVKLSDNRAGTPNVVRLWYEDDRVGLVAEARNDDPASPSSTASRGRESMLAETVDELPGDTAAKMLESLRSMAAKRLRDNSTRIEYLEFECLYAPFAIGDCVRLDYRAAGASHIGSVTSVDIDFGRGAMTKVKARRLLRPGFEAKTSGRAVWGG